jgi:GcrA cell cycle regulator
MGWTEERVELLKKLWMEGFSASQIAAELGEGVTRNAVIGKVHRLKLSGRAKPASTAPRVRSTPRSGGPRRTSSASVGSRGSLAAGLVKQRALTHAAPMIGATALKIAEDLEVEALAAPQVAELFIPVEQRLTLLQLSEHTCKWPIGDPLTTDFYFCGQHSEEGKPYCDFHSRRAYHQLEKKRR